MFRILEKKTDVLGYILDVEDVFFTKSGDKYKFQTSQYVNYVTKDFFGNPFFWNGYLIMSNPNTEKIIFFKDRQEVKKENYYCIEGMKDYLVISTTVDEVDNIIFLDKEFNDIFKNEFDSGGRSYINDNLFSCGEIAVSNKIHTFQVSSGKFRFDSVDISSNTWRDLEGDEYEGEVFQIVGQWKNELIVFIGRYRIVSFDLNTFEELWRIEDFMEEVSSNPIFDFTMGVTNFVNWKLSISEGKAYLLVRNLLYILDLEIRKSVLIKDYNEDSELDWYFKDSRLYEDYITFTGSNVLGKFPMVAGVIDKKTKEVLWSVKCEPGIYFEEAPQIKGNKLYILDSKKTLHIFEWDKK